MAHQLLRRRAVCDILGLSWPTLYRHQKEGLFIHPVRLGIRSVAWPDAEVQAIASARISGQSDDQIKGLVQRLHAARYPDGVQPVDTRPSLAPAKPGRPRKGATA